MSAPSSVKKVVLAYSGGLDTSIILKWLQTEYQAEVVTFTADLGQGEELGPARDKALLLGIKPENIFIEDLREEFVRDYVFPMFRANTLYEGQYLLGTSIARPLIAKTQIDIARKVGADAVSHGSTGKGNDQVRYELAYYALQPDIRRHRSVARVENSPAARPCCASPKSTRSRSPRTSAARRRSASTPTFCTPHPRARCWRIPRSRRRRSSISAPSPRRTRPTKPSSSPWISRSGDPVAIDGEPLSPAALLTKLNKLGHDFGVGRLDLVENRYRRHEVARRL